MFCIVTVVRVPVFIVPVIRVHALYCYSVTCTCFVLCQCYVYAFLLCQCYVYMFCIVPVVRVRVLYCDSVKPEKV